MNIRPATSADYPTMQAFGARFHAYMGYEDMPYDPESVIFWFDAMLAHGCCLVVEIQGRLVGMAGGIYSRFVFNKNYMVGQEIMWWVEPEYRAAGIGKQLLAALEDSAYSAGCSRWAMIALAGTENSVGKLYERSGYCLAETTYSKVNPWLHSSPQQQSPPVPLPTPPTKPERQVKRPPAELTPPLPSSADSSI